MRPWQRRPPAAPTAAELLIASDRFQDLPYGGFSGEMIAAAPAAPAPAPPAPLVIEPPPWAGQPEVEPVAPDPADRPDALAALKGYQPDAPDLRPPETSAPLVRPVPPKPDWRREQIEAAQRERKPRPMDEPTKSLGRFPA